MSADDEGDVTRLLVAWRDGNTDAPDELFPLLYDELRRIAGHLMRGERRDHTLQPTALVHEAYARLAGAKVGWQDRVHFYSVAARAMRRLLVDHARSQRADRRGGGAPRVTLDETLAAPFEHGADMLDLDRALGQLAELSPRRAQVVELHFFGGLTYREIAALLEVSFSTIRGDLRFALAWLATQLGDPE